MVVVLVHAWSRKETIVGLLASKQTPSLGLARCRAHSSSPHLTLEVQVLVLQIGQGRVLAQVPVTCHEDHTTTSW